MFGLLDLEVTKEEWMSEMYADIRERIAVNSVSEKPLDLFTESPDWVIVGSSAQNTQDSNFKEYVYSQQGIAYPGEYFACQLSDRVMLNLTTEPGYWPKSQLSFYLWKDRVSLYCSQSPDFKKLSLDFSSLSSAEPSILKFQINEEGGLDIWAKIGGNYEKAFTKATDVLRKYYLSVTGFLGETSKGFSYREALRVADCKIGKYESLDIPIVIDGGTPTSIAAITLGG